MSQQFTILEVQIFERPVVLRLPFKFGDTVVTETAEAHVRVIVDGAQGRISGQSAQMMVPRWFNKSANMDNAATIEELRETLRYSARLSSGLKGSIVGLSRELRALVREAMPHSVPDLACGFGPAVLEMALIDAACRANEISFSTAARNDIFGIADLNIAGFQPGEVKSNLASLNVKKSIALRHTVGYDSPLRTSEIICRPDEAPVSLDEVIAQTGIRDFKLKLKGEPESDLHRLVEIAQVLDSLPAYRVTLDANEQYSVADYDQFICKLIANPHLAKMRAATLFIEQPFPREIALEVGGQVTANDFPIIIDESDATEGSLEIALNRGWDGTSAKSCKGVLRALINKMRIDVAKNNKRSAILSAEDLTCQPGLCWQQDTLMAALIGVDHVERNGHFFGGGMQGASAEEKHAFQSVHSDIYEQTKDGPRLRIRHGRVDISSLNTPGFASGVVPDLSRNLRIEF